MSEYLFENNAVSTLTSAINDTDVSLFLQSGDGALFPDPSAGQIFTVTLEKSNGAREVVNCTNRTIDTLTVVRGQEGTTAIGFSAGDLVSCRLTKDALLAYAQKDKANSFTQAQSFNNSVYTKKGADIASANDMDLLPDGNYNDVTGTTPVNGMTIGIINEVRRFQYDGAVPLKHNTAPSAGYAKLFLPGAADYTTAAGDEFTYIYDGTFWKVVAYVLATGKSLFVDSVTTTRGDMIRRGATIDERVALGTNGYPLLAGANDPNYGQLTQTGLADNSVGQAQMKDATAAQSVSVGSDSSATLILTGGTYSMFTFSSDGVASEITFGAGNTAAGTIGFHNANSGASITAYIDGRYFIASPPYDLGDGEIPLFVMLLMDRVTKEIHSISVAIDPPWAYNGPTDIRPTLINPIDRKHLRKERDLPFPFSETINNPGKKVEWDDAFNSGKMRWVEITQARKNADMNIVPHCWPSGGPLADPAFPDVIPVMLNPFSPGINKLRYLHEDEPSQSMFDLFKGDFFNFKNDMVMKKPDALTVIGWDWK